MRNLEIYSISKEPTQFTSFSDVISINDKIYAFKDEHVCCYDKITKDVTCFENETYSDIITPFQDLPIDQVIYFSTTKLVAFINKNYFDISTFNFDSKIECTAWNPSQDSLAIIFEGGDIGLFTFDINEKSIDCKASSNLDFECPESITVGWGSNKTQFRGPLKKKTDDVLTIISDILINDENDLEPPSPTDDKRPVITWRSNGEMFSVNFWKNDRRIIKFFDSECQPIFENSGVNGLQPILAWRPYGAGIASIAIVKNKTYLVLFEKNATLRHEFPLEHQFRIEDLLWDQSGNLLSMYLKIPENGSSQIRVYIIKNNHLYLKHTLIFNNTIVNIKWLEGTSLSYPLLVATSNFLLTYRFKLTVDKMYVPDDFNCTIVAVINGHILHLCRHTQSDCSSYKDIELSEPINLVTFDEKERKLAVLGIQHLYIYQYQNVDQDPTQLCCVSIPSTHFYNIQLTRMLRLVGFDIENSERNSEIFEFDIQAVTETSEKNLQKVEGSPNEILINEKEIYFENVQDGQDSFRISMDEHRNVYLNSKLIWNNITSFITHCKCLFLTTKDTLIGIRLNSLKDTYNSKAISPYTRTIELGSVLICGMGSTSNLILQALRGNIEIISCLLINIDKIDQFLEEGNWQEAWDNIRLLKLNSNLLFDLNPDRFLTNISEFIKTSVLTVFLSELEEENILCKVYNKSGFKAVKYENKVMTICSKIVNFLTKNSYVESLTSIVHACLVMPSTTAIKEALKHIQILFRYNANNEKIQKSVEDAVKFMLKYVHIGDVYRAALSLYDLELAIFIARNSEMDPKEYIDFITKLKSMSEAERNFTINDYLGNHYMALFYLYEVFQNNGYKKLIHYMEKHNLEKALYDNISETSPIYLDVVKSYGKKLAAQKLYDEAGLVLEKGRFYDKALEMYMESRHWKKAIEMMRNLKIDQITFTRNIQEIANDLISINNELDASFLYENYLEDYETAIKLLSDTHHFSLAYEMAKKHSRLDIVETNIKPSLQDFSIYLYTEFEKLDDDYTKYSERLLKVRKEKTDRFKFKAENTDNGYHEEYQEKRAIDDDLYSVVGSVTSTKYGSSVTSTHSRSSSASSRSKRKEQRKREDLREGGQYEDIALIKVLYEKISAALSYGVVVRELCFVMLELNLKNDAKILHNFLFNVQNKMKNDIKNIWPDTLLKQDEPHNYEIKALQENLFSLDTMYWKPPVIKLDWVLQVLKS